MAMRPLLAINNAPVFLFVDNNDRNFSVELLGGSVT